MRDYRNYIFDLYGTLVDIHSDERKPSLWRLMAEFYAVYGCKWRAKQLSEAFWRMDQEERQILGERIGTDYPEIKLERVFARLLFEVPGWQTVDSVERGIENGESRGDRGLPVVSSAAWHTCSLAVAGIKVDEMRSSYLKDQEGVLSLVMESDWMTAVSNLFRVYSRKYLRLYKNTIPVLKELKVQGKRIYLLSNAQRIFTMPEIERLGLDAYFDRMYISSDYEMMKPEKRFMERLLVQEGLKPEETVMVGNEIRSDIAIAMRSGVHGIYLNTSSYTEKEIELKLKELTEKEAVESELTPDIIMSGDIKEILY